jgi:hypothetical protein
MTVTQLFSIPIYEAMFPNFETIKEPLLSYVSGNFNEKYINEYNNHDHPIRNGALVPVYERYKFEREGRTIEDQNMKILMDWITEQGKSYWKTLELSDMLDPYILNLWFTATKSGGFVASHNHNPVPVAGVFYINARPELGNLYLENPLDLLLGKSPRQSKEALPSRLNHQVDAVSGKLVLFPGWMKHFTEPNPTDEVRFSMAVNFGCQGQVYFTEFS